VTPVQKQMATSVRAGGLRIDRARPTRRKALSIGGIAFAAHPSTAYMTPKRLTIWFPKGVTVSSAPLAPCSRAFAKTMTLRNDQRCAFMLGGRLGGDLRAWQAYAGPKHGKRERLWLRGIAAEGNKLKGFSTGWIEPPSGKRTKITLELGALRFSTRGLELTSAPEGKVAPLRGTCRGGVRMRLQTAQGTATKTFPC
jgi:hypothetical protein